MPRTDSLLAPLLRDLKDTASDFKSSSFEHSERLIGLYLSYLDTEPLAGFLTAVSPVAPSGDWSEELRVTLGSEDGWPTLKWPNDRARRVALQVCLLRKMSGGERPFLDFMVEFYSSERTLQAQIRAFGSQILDGLARDIERLAESRPLPVPVAVLAGSVPPSQDQPLDGLIAQAMSYFKDPTPMAHRAAIEKLWDAWERLKSLDEPENKRLSVNSLIEQASAQPDFRDLLHAEAKALTEVGNKFHIRHFEKNRVDLDDPAHVDYLFHRMFAMLHLLLSKRTASDA